MTDPTDDVVDVLADLLNLCRALDPVNYLRTTDVVRAVSAPEIPAVDAAGAAVLRLAANIDGGSTIVRAATETLTHCVALALLLRVPPGAALLSAAQWTPSLVVPLATRLDFARRKFSAWLALVAADVRRSATTGEPMGSRAALALVAARCAVGPSRDAGEALVARLVDSHARALPLEPGDVPGSLLLAVDEREASTDGLLRRSPAGLRWVERRARDLVESVAPRRERAESIDDAERLSSTFDDPIETIERMRSVRELVDELRARGPQYVAALERWEGDESREAVAARHGVGVEAVRWAERRIREAFGA